MASLNNPRTASSVFLTLIWTDTYNDVSLTLVVVACRIHCPAMPSVGVQVSLRVSVGRTDSGRSRGA